MADNDIDIEEHNLFENPTIQRIFPDLSVLKTEITEVSDTGAKEELFNEAYNWNCSSHTGMDTDVHLCSSSTALEDQRDTTVKNNRYHNVKQYCNMKKVKLNNINKDSNLTALPSLVSDHKYLPEEKLNACIESPPSNIPIELNISNECLKHTDTSPKMEISLFSEDLCIISEGNSESNTLINFPECKQRELFEVSNLLKVNNKNNQSKNDITKPNANAVFTKVKVENEKLSEITNLTEEICKITHSEIHVLKIRSISNEYFDDLDSVTIELSDEKDLTKEHYTKNIRAKIKDTKVSEIMNSKKGELKAIKDIKFQTPRKKSLNLRLKKEKDKNVREDDKNPEIPDRKLSENSKNQHIEICASSSNIKNDLPICEKLKHKQVNNKESVSNSHTNHSVLPLQAKKYILGSKPSASIDRCKDMKIVGKNVKITLENIGNFLSKSSRYCKICCRLFPSAKILSDHNSIVHFQENDILFNSNVPLSKSDERNAFNIKRKRYKCNLCETVCSSSSNLMRHKRNIHLTKHKHNLSESSHRSKEKTFKCTHCDNNFLTQQLLIDHMYEVLQSKNKNLTESAQNIQIEPSNTKPSATARNYYRCSSCLYYFINRNVFAKHQKRKHKKTVVYNFKKVDFNPTCKNCFRKYSTVKSFNKHVWYYHLSNTAKFKIKIQRNNKKHIKTCKEVIPEKKVEKKTKEHSLFKKKQEKIVHNNCYVLKSALFKCIKCDVHFLSGNKAADHDHHLESLVNWKCLQCMRIFKKEDELLHSHQHLFSDTFDVYEISKANVLFFKCPNCMTFFLEQDLFNHFDVCEMHQPNSAYCKVCDTLIDNKIKELHNGYHKTSSNETNDSNIKFVESELIECCKDKFTPKSPEGHIELKMEVDPEDKAITNVPSKDNSFSQSEQNGEVVTKKMLSFTYCNKCNSYISRMHNLYNHTKDPCSHLTKFVCKYCGLLISNKIISRHRKLHQRVPGLTLNEFKFYDLKGRKITRPPIPKYPTCPKCLKHFITKTAIISHKCSEDYLTCSICNIKLSDSAFLLHMAFHYYLPKSKVSQITNDPFNFIEKTDSDLPIKLSAQELKPHVYYMNRSDENNQLLVYMCKICKVAVDVYDAVIEHCQDHISDPDPKETLTKPCEACNIIFDISCYEHHKNLHAKNHKKKFSVLSFDAFYATAKNNVWLDHLFGSLPKEEVDKILGKSIYNIERRIKLQVIQVGFSEITLFKCSKCDSYMDSSIMYDHCHVDILCYKSKPAPCSYCGINLVSEEIRVKHEKIHRQKKIKPKSYRIVLFNRDEDKNINIALSLPSNYILFQCRNCNGIVEKILYDSHKCCVNDLAKCSHCGLLLYGNDYTAHVLKHKEFCSFNENNMKVILIGQLKYGPKIRSRLTPSFKGVKLDYLLYQCFKCKVCIKEEEISLKHECLTSSSMTKCLVCELYFEDSQFKNHRRLHEWDAFFTKENISVVSFGCTNDRELDFDDILIEEELKKEVKFSAKFNKHTIKDDVIKSNKNIIAKKIEVYKCTCDLHFLNELSALAHFKKCNINSKSVKQVCPKCNLCFLPSEMYKHVLAHHGNKNNNCNLKIIQISENVNLFHECD